MKSYNINTKHLKLELKQSGVYCIKNTANNKFYIGSTCNSFQSRLRNHSLNLERNTHCNKYLQKSWRKYGKNNFTFIILEACEPKKKIVLNREQYYIDILFPKYNICKIAKSCKGRKMSKHNKELVRKRMSGKNNHSYDFTKYIFYHPEKGIKIKTQREFYNYSGCNYSNINQMVHNGKTISTKNWVCFGKNNNNFDFNKENLKFLYKSILKYRKIKKTRYNRCTFHFFNKKTGDKFNGTRYEFSEKYNLKLKSVRKITTQKSMPNSRNSLYGWDCTNRYKTSAIGDK